MRMLEKSQERVQEICNLLRDETLLPAKQEANALIEQAKQEAANILAEADRNAKQFLEDAKASLKRERDVFNAALKEAAKLSVESLRQEIEHTLFNPNLEKALHQQSADPKVIARFIDLLVDTVKSQSISADFSALIPAKMTPETINALIKKETLDQLAEKAVVVGGFKGGAQLRLKDKKILIDLSHETLISLMERHLRKEFRQWLFGQ